MREISLHRAKHGEGGRPQGGRVGFLRHDKFKTFLA
jgi:hypothetical protein